MEVTDLNFELLDGTNDFRAEHQGLMPLQWHEGLARVAKDHATQVAEGRAPFSHDGAQERFKACGARCINVAENLARSDGFDREALPGAAIAGWKGSEGHRRNLLGPFNVCGIGWAASDAGTIFVTQLLAMVDEEQQNMQGLVWDYVVNAAQSTPGVCTAVGAFTGGPVLALTGGAVGYILDKRFGLQLSNAPRVLRDRAMKKFYPTTCSNCGVIAEATEELLATSSPVARSSGGVGGTLLCRNCHPSPEAADVWCYVD